MALQWTHAVQFIADEDGLAHFGQVDSSVWPDVGLSVKGGERVDVKLIDGSLFHGSVTDTTMHIKQLLSPISPQDVPIIRGIGLNYYEHAKEANLPIPEEPMLFIKPRTSLIGPAPSPIQIPRFVQDGTSDYEAELAVILSKSGRDIPETSAMDYVLGFTCSNDVSARREQFKNSQVSFSKGLDSSCPLGPVLVFKDHIDPANLSVKAIYNGEVVQDFNTGDMIFSVAKLVSYLSQGTTLEKGTIILTGTGPGVGILRSPKITLRHDDDMRIEISQIGTLINQVVFE